MTDTQRQALFRNAAAVMGGAPELVKRRHVEDCIRRAPDYGAGVANALGSWSSINLPFPPP